MPFEKDTYIQGDHDGRETGFVGIEIHRNFRLSTGLLLQGSYRKDRPPVEQMDKRLTKAFS